MLIEQEIAGIMKFALRAAGNPNPYYYDVPEDFHFPAMYFPQPEINTGGDTFSTYAMRYYWNINVFAETTEEAYERAYKVISVLKQKRNIVQLVNKNGDKENDFIRLDDPSLKVIDSGVVKLTLSWTSRREYEYTEAKKMLKWVLHIGLEG